MGSAVPFDFSQSFFPCSFGCCGCRPGSFVSVRASPHPRVPQHGGTGKWGPCRLRVDSCSDFWAPIRVVPALDLPPPLSPLLRSLLGDLALALPLFLGDCPSAAFLPVPGRLRRKVLRDPPPLYLVCFSPARAVRAYPRVRE